MSAEPKLIPAGSQTVGPYFRIGLEYLIDRAASPEPAAEGILTIRGQVLDRDCAPVVDAMLEFWNASDASARSNVSSVGFARAATDDDGNFCVHMARPSALASDDGTLQAPHMLVLVFARGLLRHLISRVYFEGESGNSADPVLNTISAERRHTLVAKNEDRNSFRWDVILQGNDETVFFAW
jgi:protocatechuate 3,4-dioxygenase alpha subunit